MYTEKKNAPSCLGSYDETFWKGNMHDLAWQG